MINANDKLMNVAIDGSGTAEARFAQSCGVTVPLGPVAVRPKLLAIKPKSATFTVPS